MLIPSKFGFSIETRVPEHPEVRETVEKFLAEYKWCHLICETVLPYLEETGFFEKTRYIFLGIGFSVVGLDESCGIIKIKSIGREYISWLRKDRIVMADKTLHKTMLLSKLNDNFDKFAYKEIAEILRQVCKKYKLDSSPVDALLVNHS